VISLFEKLYEGDPWIDVNINDTLKNISAEKAQKRIMPHSNSIWEIVQHLISWRQNVIQRLKGIQMVTPAHNYFEIIENKSTTDWNKTLKALAVTNKEWIEFLETFKTTNFDKIYAANEMTFYEHIHGILQHDAYHLGQIVMIAKYV
jgi:uncharacterized damage-inducible protein DinB